ncbi:ATP-binding protein [Pseudohaliea rubra]|uniref:histidine kinase n=1 Tax=Pseudohaliea rubra DSM 19751 TaxID=1265313 RepID=A0A095VSB1_9GAMM|nr:ATP-binding protein [Pseudohaliea rubra]KGE04342.1 Sensor protein PhoQ [Pseudohaliea rubra DSM 19751]
MSRRPLSLAARLFLASALLLPVALGATGWYLERAHRLALDAAAGERLQLQVLALLAQADYNGGLTLPLVPLEPRLAQPNSGLYALVTGGSGEPLWLSPSAALLPQPIATLAGGTPDLAPGQRHRSERAGLLRHSYQVLWETEAGDAVPLRFLVAESTAPRDADVAAYRRSLWFWLGATIVVLLAMQGLILAWGLRPLARLAEAIARIEAGEAARLDGPWPREVRPVTENLQLLLNGEQQRRERMRNTLADLAHSLKTPLAVLRNAEPGDAAYPALLDEQLERMEQVIGWHLQRAAGGSSGLLQRVAVAPVLERLRATLLKVYADRQLALETHCPAASRFRGDERDLLELLGNLLDNACKYAAARVRVTVAGGSAGEGLLLTVEDDGAGISPELRDLLLHRGARADSRREGQGIGLAVVLEIVHAQRGELVLEDSELGGARVCIRLP